MGWGCVGCGCVGACEKVLGLDECTRHTEVGWGQLTVEAVLQASLRSWYTAGGGGGGGGGGGHWIM